MTSSAAGLTLRWRRIRWNGVNSDDENSGEPFMG